MKIQKLVLGMARTNCYLATEEDSTETVIIDPADVPERISEAIRRDGLKVKGILLTHGHFDHIYAVEELARLYRVPVFAGENEAELLESVVLNESASVGRECTLVPDVLLKDGEKVAFGHSSLTVIATPGHTAGSVCYYGEGEGVLFSGDTLFFESVGRTDLHTGNPEQLERSIRERLYHLHETTVVYPGHGPKTTIGYEMKNNPYVEP